MQQSSGALSAMSGDETTQVMKANYERDQHKWSAEKTQLTSELRELENAIRLKDEEAAKREQRLTQRHEQALEQQEEVYEERWAELRQEIAKLKNAKLFHENHMHALSLEHEKSSKLISSSFYYLGLSQVNKDRDRDRRGGRGFDVDENTEVDWLESQRDNIYAHGYESLFRTGQ